MKKIVVVEDDLAIRDIFHIVFGTDMFHVTSLHTGLEITLHEIDPPHLFIVDKQLPDMDGMELCRFIKTSDKFKEIPVVMMSGHPNLHKLATEAGADGSLEKPFSLQELRATIHQHL